MMINLEEMPLEHPMRNVPMNTIGTEMRTKGSRDWVNIAAFSIGYMTYNELGPCWTEMHEFQGRPPKKVLDPGVGVG